MSTCANKILGVGQDESKKIKGTMSQQSDQSFSLDWIVTWDSTVKSILQSMEKRGWALSAVVRHFR